MAAAHPGAGHRHVDPLLGQAAVELRARELRLARVDRRLEPLAERVERHARLAVAHLAQRELQLALAAEVLDAHVLDLVDRRGRRDCGERGVLECLGVHGSAEVTNVPSACLNRPDERLRGLRTRLRRVGGGHDRRRRLLRRARAARRDGPVDRARRRHGSDLDPDRRAHGSARHRDRLVASDARASRASVRPRPASTSSCARRHARPRLRRGERPRHLPVPRAPPPADVAGSAARVRARRRAPCARVAGSPGTRSSSTTAIAAEARRQVGGRAAAATSRPTPPGDNRIDIRSSTGPTLSLWWVARSEWEGLLDVAGLETEALYGWFDRRPVRRREPRVRLGRAQAG